MTVADDPIASIRRFNRFYTRLIGLLDEGMLSTRFSLTEMRILYELANRPHRTATDLGRDLGLDPGYLSRILKKFDADGLLARQTSPIDGRQTELALTTAGKTAFAPLDQRSRDQVANLIAPLPASARRTLVDAMSTITGLLGDADPKASATAAPAPWLLRSLKVGDLGWIIRRQGMLYAEEYGWDASYEALVAEIAAAFVKNFQPRQEACWVAEVDGQVVGSVFVVKQSDEVAKLRLLYVEPSTRGLGIGRRLIDECLDFARRQRYRKMTLWTNDVLSAARHLYQRAGFTLTHSEPHHSFGHDLVGETWEIDLVG